MPPTVVATTPAAVVPSAVVPAVANPFVLDLRSAAGARQSHVVPILLAGDHRALFEALAVAPAPLHVWSIFGRTDDVADAALKALASIAGSRLPDVDSKQPLIDGRAVIDACGRYMHAALVIRDSGTILLLFASDMAGPSLRLALSASNVIVITLRESMPDGLGEEILRQISSRDDGNLSADEFWQANPRLVAETAPALFAAFMNYALVINPDGMRCSVVEALSQARPLFGDVATHAFPPRDNLDRAAFTATVDVIRKLDQCVMGKEPVNAKTFAGGLYAALTNGPLLEAPPRKAQLACKIICDENVARQLSQYRIIMDKALATLEEPLVETEPFLQLHMWRVNEHLCALQQSLLNIPFSDLRRQALVELAKELAQDRTAQIAIISERSRLYNSALLLRLWKQEFSVDTSIFVGAGDKATVLLQDKLKNFTGSFLKRASSVTQYESTLDKKDIEECRVIANALREKQEDVILVAAEMLAKLEAVASLQNAALADSKAMMEASRAAANRFYKNLSNATNKTVAELQAVFQQHSIDIVASFKSVHEEVDRCHDTQVALALDATNLSASVEVIRREQVPWWHRALQAVVGAAIAVGGVMITGASFGAAAVLGSSLVSAGIGGAIGALTSAKGLAWGDFLEGMGKSFVAGVVSGGVVAGAGALIGAGAIASGGLVGRVGLAALGSTTGKMAANVIDGRALTDGLGVAAVAGAAAGGMGNVLPSAGDSARLGVKAAVGAGTSAGSSVVGAAVSNVVSGKNVGDNLLDSAIMGAAIGASVAMLSDLVRKEESPRQNTSSTEVRAAVIRITPMLNVTFVKASSSKNSQNSAADGRSDRDSAGGVPEGTDVSVTDGHQNTSPKVSCISSFP
ncbi:hypothetical protein HK101_003637 [Irineochytrium annulatum]|nr:hypothetical protein HK101_003637 [Irineochytrium annulatum]